MPHMIHVDAWAVIWFDAVQLGMYAVSGNIEPLAQRPVHVCIVPPFHEILRLNRKPNCSCPTDTQMYLSSEIW